MPLWVAELFHASFAWGQFLVGGVPWVVKPGRLIAHHRHPTEGNENEFNCIRWLKRLSHACPCQPDTKNNTGMNRTK
jgi:hypothetical protein